MLVSKQKPGDQDFVSWMENMYEITCLDYNCSTFEFTHAEGKEPIVMQTVHGTYSPGTFVMEVDRQYRNLEDSSYYLDIEVNGFLSDFTLEEEIIDGIPKK